MKEIGLSEIGDYVRVLHCGIRWKIIEYLRDGPKSSDEIFNHLVELRDKGSEDTNNCKGKCNNVNKKDLKKPTLYYHLRELESVGIIKLDEYKPSEQKRAPEKVWKLNMEKLTINLK
ncbi:MAG: helix-turn-helix transcriptional regulator [Candidatus Lokiarchaeota archaeon]|nr:helix-turn-helix transcriptional regulator [Candidatus Lokiarchaeota archaeon]